MNITAVQRSSYRDNGFVVIEGLVGAEDVRRISNRLDDLQDSSKRGSVQVVNEPGSPSDTPILRKFAELAVHDPLFARIAAHPAITEVASELTGGGEIMLYSDQAFLKPALCGSAKPLHQDNSYFRINPDDRGVTCWMAIDDATLENGCMRYIPGSHRFGKIRHKEIAGTPHLIPDVDRPLGLEVPVPIPAGACIFHHLSVLHASLANTSPKHRRSWTLHYANRSAISCQRPWGQMIRVR
jgi:ectoine hydroxylase-related dioxygenase (phytanoyl-CoA dioxygenase family)